MVTVLRSSRSGDLFEQLYVKFNRREYVHPDPIEFLYPFDDLRDREIVGLVASSLAYGRVSQILRSVTAVVERMEPAPHRFLAATSREELVAGFCNFKHRFSTGEELAALLYGIKETMERYETLQNCFASFLDDGDETIEAALCLFVEELRSRSRDLHVNSLLPCPTKGSACKRLNLFLRWMVRRDDIDPGGWDDVPASKLIVPLDTHMYGICRMLNITGRKQASMRTALEITRYFRRIVPHDPVKYDFSLTRLGILKNSGPA